MSALARVLHLLVVSTVLAVLAVLAGCAARRPVADRPAAPAPAPPDPRAEACSAPIAPASRASSALPAEGPPEGTRIARISVRGAHGVPASMVYDAMATHAGSVFDSAAIDADLVRIEQIGAFEDVRVAFERRENGVDLIVEVDERPAIGAVFFQGDALQLDDEPWSPPLAGDLYDLAAVARALRVLRRMWAADGHLDGRVGVRARRVDAGRVDLCIDLDRGPVWTVERVDLPGASIVPADALRAAMRMDQGESNTPGKPYRADALHDDLAWMLAEERDHGLVMATIGPPTVTRIAERHAIRIEIPVSEGKVYRIGRITLEGRLPGPRAKYTALLRQAPGDVFSRSLILESIERVKIRHRELTKEKNPQVVPSSEIHLDEGTIDIVIHVKGA